MKRRFAFMLPFALGLASVAQAGPGQPDPAKFEAMMGWMKEKLTKRITEELALTPDQSQQVAQSLDAAEASRAQVRQKIWPAMQTLRSAAKGDSTALSQVDVSIRTILDARAQLAALDSSGFADLSRGFTAQQRAKLILVVARFRHGHDRMHDKDKSD